MLPEEDKGPRFFARKKPTSLYFPENTRIIAEPRTNALILLGPKDAITQIEEFIKKHIDVLKADVVKIDQYVEHYKGTLLPFSLAGTGSEVFKEVIDVQREAASIFTSNLKNIDQLSSISKSFQLDSSVSEELEKIRSKTHLKAKDLSQAFAHIRSYEDLCYQSMMLVEEEEERRRKQALLEEQRIEKAKKAAELRKKSLQKKLLWTGGFIIILVGFLKSQMV